MASASSPPPPPSESLDQSLPSENPSVPQPEDRPQSHLPPAHSESHPSKTLTLEPPNLHTPQPLKSPPNPPDADQNDDVPDGDGSSVSSAGNAVVNVYKRGAKRKKSHLKRLAHEKKSMKKLEALNETLKPVPFSPVKSLDFLSHEKLLKRLGLWDFVHIEFDQVIRADLLAQLIANFSHGQRCSYVNGVRVMVNRADLARALKLPVKKFVAVVSDDGGDDEVPATEESIAFIEDFVSNWLLLHDDTWMMPNEVLNWTKAIKEGNFEKVDWAGMIWFMVEKELDQAPQLANCYYASHLQYLVKSQKEELFLSREVEEEDEDEHRVEIEVKGNEEIGEEENANGDVRMSRDGSEVHGHELEEHNTELSLGHDNVVEHNVELSISQDNDVEKAGTDKKADAGKEENAENETDAEKEADGQKEENAEKEADGQKEENAEKEADAEKEDDAEKEAEMEMEVDGRKEEVVARKEEEEEGVGGNSEERVGEKKEEVFGQESAMDFEECKENDERASWFLDGKNNVGEPFLRQCSFGVEPKDLICEDERKQEDEEEEEVGRDDEEEEEEEEEEMQHEVEDDEEEMEEEEQEEQGEQGGFHISRKGFPHDGLNSGSLIHSLDVAHLNLVPGMSLREPLEGEFLTPRDDTRMSLDFGNGSTSKRDHISLENHNSHNALNGNKRLRIDGPWDNNRSSSDFDVCMEQLQHLMGKARMMYAAKEQACTESTMNQQMLLNELQQRDAVIEQLNKERMEVLHKRQIEVYRLERELNLMSNLLDGYRKALKETRKAFSDYRACCPQLDEPLYKDVAGSGGLVLSAMELEKQRLKQEEEDRMSRLMFERKIKDLEAWWDEKFSALGESVTEWDKKLVSVEQEMKILKESYYAKPTVQEASEPAQNDS